MSNIAPIPGSTVNLSTSTTTAREAITSSGGSQVRVYNASSSEIAFIELGDSTVVATDADFPLGPEQEIFLEIGGQTHLAGITAANTAELYVTAVHTHVGS